MARFSIYLMIFYPINFVNQKTEHSWREYECMAREFMMAEHPGKDHYIMSGTHGTLDWMHGKMHEVRVPEYYWKAQCYDDGKSAWAWVSPSY